MNGISPNDSPQSKKIDEETVSSEEVEAEKSLESIKQLIDQHLERIALLLINTKEKDNNILNLTLRVREYEDGIGVKFFESLAKHIAKFREDIKKVIDEHKEDYSLEDLKKYLRWTHEDFEELFYNLALEEKDGVWLYKGQNLESKLSSRPTLNQEVMAPVELMSAANLTSLDEVPGFLAASLETIQKVLQNNTVIDKVLAHYISISGLYEENALQIMLFPVFKKLVSLFIKSKKRGEEMHSCEEEKEYAAFYLNEMHLIVEGLKEILELCGVTTLTYLGDFYVLGQQQIMRRIASEDPNDDGKIIRVLSDCYMRDEKVIVRQKVDVYYYDKSKQADK